MERENTFFDRIYRLVVQIPHGKVASYGQIAAMLDQPRAARTVGWALSQLPQTTDVPWHRVINSRGRVSIKSARYTAELQQNMLVQEGVVFDENGYCDMAIFQWRPDLADAVPDENPNQSDDQNTKHHPHSLTIPRKTDSYSS